MNNNEQHYLLTEKLDAIAKITDVFAGTVQWKGEAVHGYILRRQGNGWEIVTDTDDPTQDRPDDRRRNLTYDQVRRLEDILQVDLPDLDSAQ